MFFFFSSRRRHTRFDCDWSSDVCSSDLFVHEGFQAAGERNRHAHGVRGDEGPAARDSGGGDPARADAGRPCGGGEARDRKSGVEGKRGDLGGRRIIKKKKKKIIKEERKM